MHLLKLIQGYFLNSKELIFSHDLEMGGYLAGQVWS